MASSSPLSVEISLLLLSSTFTFLTWCIHRRCPLFHEHTKHAVLVAGRPLFPQSRTCPPTPESFWQRPVPPRFPHSLLPQPRPTGSLHGQRNRGGKKQWLKVWHHWYISFKGIRLLKMKTSKSKHEIKDFALKMLLLFYITKIHIQKMPTESKTYNWVKKAVWNSIW